jgi:hypothetical protein
MKTLTITLPLPDRRLSPNARVHWAVKARLVKAHRIRAKLAALSIAGYTPAWEKASLHSEWRFPTARFWDADNCIASLKSYIDGIADAGLVANDRAIWPERPTMAKDKDNPCVVLTLTQEK